MQFPENVLYYEDLVAGTEKKSTQPYRLIQEEIIEFASKWDPQPFHINPAAAEKITGGIIASSTHTFAISARLANQLAGQPTAVLVGLGWDKVRLPNPARPGDELIVVSTIAEKRPSESRKDAGIIVSLVELRNQNGQIVMSYEISAMVQMRGSL